ncbi:MAG TPA: hypothetical protein VM432_09255, partial [Bdellovibrionales bacterium]|nr:hypothetical protein [Bdellovibrionales bacterium]
LENNTKCAIDILDFQFKRNGETMGFRRDGKLVKSYWASMNPLSPTEEACYQKYLDPKHEPKTIKGVAVYKTACNTSGMNKHYMAEWRPRYKFFRRIRRFPLCNTPEAKAELEALKL